MHTLGGRFRARYGASRKQASKLLQVDDCVSHPQPKQRVAAAQVMVQEGQRRADGEAVQPQRHFCQLDSHRVLVDAVDATLQHHATDDGLVGKQGLVQYPARVVGALQEVPPDCRHAFHQRRNVAAVQPLGDRGDILDQFRDVVGKKVHGGDQEMAAAHRRVQYLQVQRRFRRVQLQQFGPAFGFGAMVTIEFPRPGLERLETLFYQRSQGTLHNQIDQFLWGEEAAAILAGVRIEAYGNPAGVVAKRLAFQQAFVD